ncbi:MAG: recombinase family protein [Selenomonadaceae bacterium]|nr:recombinase family protein [Selenomonadaceae bacterium]
MKDKTAQAIYGYARVSSVSQNEDRQILALREMGVPENNIYVDKMSGKNFDRPAYKKLMNELCQGAVLYIKSIDRLGRNYSDIGEQWRIITKEKKADVCVIDMPVLDTRREKNLLGTFISDIILALLSYCSDNELSLIHQRQREGIEAARANGVRLGRPPKPLPDNFHKVCKEWALGKISTAVAAKQCGLPESTFRYKAKIYRQQGI